VKLPVIAVVVCGILVSGCQRKAEGQTVAVVNGQEITIPELNFALSQVPAAAEGDKNAVRSQVLQKLVDRTLLAEQARKEGVDKTPDFLNRQRQLNEDLLISMLADRRLKTAQMPSDQDVETFIANNPQAFANRESWELDQVAYTTPTDPKIQSEIQNAHSIDALVAVLQQHQIAFTRGKNHVDTGTIPPGDYAKISKMPTGEPFAVAFGSKTIASAITTREPHPTPADNTKPAAVQAIRKNQTAKSIQDLLKSLRSTAKIEYQPGFAPKKS
jgi:peptidyl-prolyl cis-trans isomerase C